MNAKHLLTGVIVGAAIGAVAAITMTPQSGQQLRSNIHNNSLRYKNLWLDVKAEGGNVQNAVSALTNEAKNNIPNIINELKENFTNFKKDIVPETEKLKQEIEGLQNSVSEIEKNISIHLKKQNESQ